ncbi:MAG: ATP-binding protein [Hyphomicrobium sp.]|nr:ATP-binding protein [Hyphomicrobium sp.]
MPHTDQTPATGDAPALALLLERIASALERLSPGLDRGVDFTSADAFVWHGDGAFFQPVAHVNRIPLEMLKGIDRTAATLLDNTRRFASGLAANNALLWGARGMGKSSLVKAAHAEAARTAPTLKLIEIHREDIATLPACLTNLRTAAFRFLVFCDDLSFDKDDTHYKSLKAVLEGGIEGRPENVLFYATSNRRHLMPREMIDNERSTAITPGEAIEEKVSLSDRFGLWLGFHNASQDDYLAMVRAYAAHYRLEVTDGLLIPDALEWATTRGARSGRVAWQFINDLAGRLGKAI